MRKSIVARVLVVAAAFGAVFYLRPGTDRHAVPPSPLSPVPSPVVHLSVGRATLEVELAQTPDEWAQGLSRRTALAAEAGMLFLFPSLESRAFWMKDALIPLDLIWIREGRVVGITSNIQPEQGVPDAQLRRYPSPGPVDHVLEVNAGWAKQNGVTVGDQAGFVGED